MSNGTLTVPAASPHRFTIFPRVNPILAFLCQLAAHHAYLNTFPTTPHGYVPHPSARRHRKLKGYMRDPATGRRRRD